MATATDTAPTGTHVEVAFITSGGSLAHRCGTVAGVDATWITIQADDSRRASRIRRRAVRTITPA